MNNIKDLKNIKPNLIMDVVSCDIAKLQIDEIGSTLIVKAKVSPDSAFSQIEIYDDNDDVEIAEIIKGGMYTIDVAGYNVIKLECGNDIKGVISLKTEGESIIVDSFLSDTSTHAVQNKVITEAFNNKQDVLSFDTTPTEGSSNPVTSGGIKSALDLKADKTETIGKSGTGTNSEIFNDYTNNEATAQYSHAEGNGTIAAGENQHVEGKFNIEDTADKYVHIVGNGNGNTSSVNYKSNAHTLDWNGNAWFQGNIKIGGNSYDDENAQTLVTQRVLNNYAKVINTSVVVSTTDWISLTDTNGDTYYKKTIEVANVIEDGQSTIDVELPTEDIAAARLQKEAYQCIDQCIVNTGNIVLYCYELIPAVSFTLKIQILY